MERLFSTKDIDKKDRKIAYFSMEIGFDSRIPTYSGGLGVLAGDTLKSCADLHVPVIGVTLLSRKGYFYQKINDDGWQNEEEFSWSTNDFLEPLDAEIIVKIEGRDVKVRAWKYILRGIKEFEVPILYLDTNIEGNSDEDRKLTDYLYGHGHEFRLKQEVILGIGGHRILHALGYENIKLFHMNEGHSALLTLDLLSEHEIEGESDVLKRFDSPAVRRRCVFTTHTPVPAGHDQFEFEIVKRIMREDYIPFPIIEKYSHDNKLNMTYLGLNLSHYINGVAKKHAEISKSMFPGYSIDSITNGVHSASWAGPAFKELYDKNIPGWRCDPFTLRYALKIPKEDIWQTHMKEKRRILDFVNSKNNSGMDKDVFTIGFARRATAYKRAKLLFHNNDWLKSIAEKMGPIQIIFGGKAHPNDNEGKKIIQDIYKLSKDFHDKIKIAYIENYDIYKAKLLVAGVDVWLNTPLRPREASGTSGMKACVNGVLNFSVLDGWWLEGHIEDVTGWSIGPKMQDQENVDDEDAEDLYQKLEEKILPLFYHNRDEWIRMMRHSIAFNASFFNTHRMVQQYVMNAYFK